MIIIATQRSEGEVNETGEASDKAGASFPPRKVSNSSRGHL